MFDKVTFEIASCEDGVLDNDDILAVVHSRRNACLLDEIGSYLRRYDKYLELSDTEQTLLDKIRQDVFDIIDK